MRSYRALSHSVLLFLFGLAMPASGQGPSPDPMGKFITDMFNMHEGQTLCTDRPTTLAEIRANVIEQLKATSVSQSVSMQAVGIALWTRYPCPFSPFRAELRPASQSDIEGVWLFPESSQKYRFGPRSTQKPPAFGPVKCDAVGYYPGGELRHAVISGQMVCPFQKAADLDVARKNPRVSNWSLLREGRVGVQRTDVANHIEEWDVYVVIKEFEVHDLKLKVGDLVAYVRRENGNEVNAATQFRHLQRLQ